MNLFLSALLLLAGVTAAGVQDSFRSSRPQGYFGDGHAEHHQHYLGLKNRMGGSCCDGTDGRPTTGRWNPETEGWEALVNGQWQPVPWPNVLTEDVLGAQGRQRWDSQSHVFASKHKKADGTYSIYCFIPPGSLQ